MRDPAALPALLDLLSNDSFWMVRCAAVEALQMIGDPQAVPGLLLAAERDGFQAVRSYAARAAAKLSG
jgi:HEAT repeat protein